MARPRKAPAPDLRTPLTWRGLTARYTDLELEEAAALPSNDEGRYAAAVIHEAKALLDAELLPTGPRLARGRYGS